MAVSNVVSLRAKDNLHQVGFTEEQIAIIKSTFAKEATPEELKLFIQICVRRNLDPFLNQIMFQKRNSKGEEGDNPGEKKMVVLTTIDGYRAIASENGQLAGISDYVYDTEDAKNPGKATTTVKKLLPNGTMAEFSATARWKEYYPGDNKKGNFMWNKMPYNQLGKCSEALALRKAFPNSLSGIYTDAELDQAGSEPTTGNPNEGQQGKKTSNKKQDPVPEPQKIEGQGQDVETGGHALTNEIAPENNVQGNEQKNPTYTIKVAQSKNKDGQPYIKVITTDGEKLYVTSPDDIEKLFNAGSKRTNKLEGLNITGEREIINGCDVLKEIVAIE